MHYYQKCFSRRSNVGIQMELSVPGFHLSENILRPSPRIEN